MSLTKEDALMALAALLTGEGNETANPIAEMSPEMQVAKKARKEKINEVGRDLANDLKEVLEKYDFDTGVMLQTAAAGVAPFISVRDQYFWSVNAADKAGQRLARLESTGQWDDVARGNANSDDDGSGGQGEINPVRAAEDALRYHNRNAEQYEVLTHAFNCMWVKCEGEQLVDSGKEASFVPEFNIDDGEYQKYLKRQEQRRNRTPKAQQIDTNAQATRIMRETTTSFVNTGAETATEE
jgi:hypothetical protein